MKYLVFLDLKSLYHENFTEYVHAVRDSIGCTVVSALSLVEGALGNMNILDVEPKFHRSILRHCQERHISAGLFTNNEITCLDIMDS